MFCIQGASRLNIPGLLASQLDTTGVNTGTVVNSALNKRVDDTLDNLLRTIGVLCVKSLTKEGIDVVGDLYLRSKVHEYQMFKQMAAQLADL